MKDLFEVEVKTTATFRAGNIPKGLTVPVAKIVEKAIPFLERAAESVVTSMEKEATEE